MNKPKNATNGSGKTVVYGGRNKPTSRAGFTGYANRRNRNDEYALKAKAARQAAVDGGKGG